MTIKTPVSRGASNVAVARLLGVTEGAVRYHLGRMATGAMDGRSTKAFKATAVAEANRALAAKPTGWSDQSGGVTCVAGGRARL